jgi:SAM-dependent methyltransferase
MMPVSVADINRKGFSSPKVGSWYSRRTEQGLEDDERAALNWLLEHHGPANDLLDLGVGAGRTVEPLRSFVTKNYIGVDFSPEMIAICRERFPSVDFRIGDARDLSMFSTGSFDVVFFSFNGIDYVDQAGRLAILAEVHRVLRPGGAFVFSSHNRDARPVPLWRTRFVWFVFHLPWILAGNIRHIGFRRFETRTEEYEILNDEGHGYRMLTYYINSGKQMEQLKRAGFHGIEIFDTAGLHLDGTTAGHSAWLCYLCRA